MSAAESWNELGRKVPQERGHVKRKVKEAGNGGRTRNIQLGRLALCQLSYSREVGSSTRDLIQSQGNPQGVRPVV